MHICVCTLMRHWSRWLLCATWQPFFWSQCFQGLISIILTMAKIVTHATILAHFNLTNPLLLQISISTGDVAILEMQPNVTSAPANCCLWGSTLQRYQSCILSYMSLQWSPVMKTNFIQAWSIESVRHFMTGIVECVFLTHWGWVIQICVCN